MAIYKITSLNYITAGNNRAFINLDTILDYELGKPNYILRNEEPYIDPVIISSYHNYNNIVSDWNKLSGILSSFNNINYIQQEWNNISNEITSVILNSTKENMICSPLSVLCSDIVTEQKYYDELNNNHKNYIALNHTDFNENIIDKIENFNKKRSHINRTFILDTNLASRRYAEGYDGVDSSLNNMTITSNNNLIYPMYDIIDVHIKCAYKSINSNLKKFDADITGKREDIYLPQLKSDPIEFCQVQNNAFMLTEATNIESGILKSSLYKQRSTRETKRTYNVLIDHDSIKTYLYKKDQNGNIDIQNTPQSNLIGIEYNNIIEFPQNDIKVGYSEGNEYGYFTRGKNILDSQYSMNIKKEDNNLSVYNCRNYIGINQFGGDQLYYKFYDNISYEGLSTGVNSVVSMNKVDKNEFPIVSYQKIETSYINKYSSTNLHKTGFFSIKLMNTELGQYENVSDNILSANTLEYEQKKLYSQIMQDIRGAIKEIVENLQPAHTQLYKITFDS